MVKQHSGTISGAISGIYIIVVVAVVSHEMQGAKTCISAPSSPPQPPKTPSFPPQQQQNKAINKKVPLIAQARHHGLMTTINMVLLRHH
eukprot:3889561-Ditylum_brightwellii.AAC.2